MLVYIEEKKIMSDVLLYGAAFITFMHGLIHLMGLAAYWKLAEIDALPYKTTLLDGRWDVGDSGIRVFGVLWLAGAVGFMIAAYGLVTDQSWWQAAMAASAVLSLALTILDWKVAYAGVAVNIVILALLIVVPRL